LQKSLRCCGTGHVLVGLSSLQRRVAVSFASSRRSDVCHIIDLSNALWNDLNIETAVGVDRAPSRADADRDGGTRPTVTSDGTQSADTPNTQARQDARSSRSRRRDRRFRAIGPSARGGLPMGLRSVVVVSGADIVNLRRAGAEPQPVPIQKLVGSALRGLHLSRGARALMPPGLRL
jgi:hypothetical protein